VVDCLVQRRVSILGAVNTGQIGALGHKLMYTLRVVCVAGNIVQLLVELRLVNRLVEVIAVLEGLGCFELAAKLEVANRQDLYVHTLGLHPKLVLFLHSLQLKLVFLSLNGQLVLQSFKLESLLQPLLLRLEILQLDALYLDLVKWIHREKLCVRKII
jgi:hypothetical protein